MKDYKVELMPSFWHITLSKGEYSYYEEEHLFFHANDELEVWDYLCRYADKEWSNRFNYFIKWGDKKFIVDNGWDKDVDWTNNYLCHQVEMERLHVIGFRK